MLVLYDMIGMAEDALIEHTRRYAEVGHTIRGAAEAYARDVRAGAFPAAEHATPLGPGEAEVISAMRPVERRRSAEVEDDDAEIRPYGGND